MLQIPSLQGQSEYQLWQAVTAMLAPPAFKAWGPIQLECIQCGSSQAAWRLRLREADRGWPDWPRHNWADRVSALSNFGSGSQIHKVWIVIPPLLVEGPFKKRAAILSFPMDSVALRLTACTRGWSQMETRDCSIRSRYTFRMLPAVLAGIYKRPPLVAGQQLSGWVPVHQKGCYKELDMGVQRCKWAAEFSGDEVCHKKRKLPAHPSMQRISGPWVRRFRPRQCPTYVA
jgi:hypothetical protein